MSVQHHRALVLALALATAIACGCGDEPTPPALPGATSTAAEPAARAGAARPAEPAAEDDRGNHIYEAKDGSRLSAMLVSSRGTRFPAEIEFPPKAAGNGRAAALIVPSQVHGMRHPQTLELALQLRTQGMAVMRYDSNSYGPRSTEPGDLVAQVSELESALALLSTQPRVDPTRVLLIGRGSGAVAGYAVFTRSEALRALALLEPPCIDARGFAVRYPKLAGLQRPALFASQRSAVACPYDVLARAASKAPDTVELATVAEEDLPAAVLAFWQRIDRPPAP